MKKIQLSIARVALPLLFTASISQAAVTFDSSGGAQIVSTSPMLWSHTVTSSSDTVLMVAVSFEDNSGSTAAPTGITFGSQNFTQLSINTFLGFNQVSMWYLMNPDVTTADITVSGISLIATTNSVKGTSVSFAGVGAVPAPVSTVQATTSGPVLPSITFSDLATDSAVFAAIAYSAAGTATGATSGLTFPTGGSFTGQQAAHHVGYETGLSGNETVFFTNNAARAPMIAAILTPVPEPGSLLLGALGASGLLRRRRSN